MSSRVENFIDTFRDDPAISSLYGFVGTNLMISFHQLGVFKQILEYGHGVKAQLIASDLKLDGSLLKRSMESAAAWGLLTEQDGLYSVPESVARLVGDKSESYIGPIIEHFQNNTVPLLGYLPDALKSGYAQWSKDSTEQGRSPKHAFSNLFDNPEYAQAFHQAMWKMSYSPSLELVAKGVLADSRDLVDLGGGSGPFAIAACHNAEQVNAVVLDLPPVRDYCLANVEKHGLANRINFLAGDFWQDIFPEADAYALGYVLSNWDDHDCVKLLRKVRQSLRSGGRVIILERLLEEDRSGPFMGLMQDMAMMVETGGMHRSVSHYNTLLNESGFNAKQIIYSSFDKHAIIGTTSS